jgi:uncharacterized protein YbjT (DUF2867 family)/ligand-binding SRPBCC domain-containing protein
MSGLNILVTGASGFIGTRLVPKLLAAGHTVRCMSRRPERLRLPEGVQGVQADVLDVASLQQALAGVDVAYYLVHSMEKSSAGHRSFAERDAHAARNFTHAAAHAGVQRIIYLGGLGETGDNLSAHLASRRDVGEILQSGAVATTIFRAAIIVGAWGSSFTMIQKLVERLPAMICPRWVNTDCQPIAVDDVIFYLVACLRVEATIGRTIDIGGPDVLSYRAMMQQFARILGRWILILRVPVLTPRLSSYWVHLVTPTHANLARPLIEGLKNRVVCRDDTAQQLMPHTCLTYERAIQCAIEEQGSGSITWGKGCYQLAWEQRVAAPRHEVLRIFADPHNVAAMTPPQMGFVLQPPIPAAITTDTEMTYRLRVLGMPVHWRSRITVWEPPARFEDVQLRGPYAYWHHVHTFEEVGEHTRVIDRVQYRLPMGLLGRLAHSVLVGWQLRTIFAYRSQQLARLL